MSDITSDKDNCQKVWNRVRSRKIRRQCKNDIVFHVVFGVKLKDYKNAFGAENRQINFYTNKITVYTIIFKTAINNIRRYIAYSSYRTNIIIFHSKIPS